MRLRRLLFAPALLFVIAAAMPATAQIKLTWLRTEKVEQIIGDVDWDVDTPTPQPASGTFKNFGVLSNGLGYSFEHFDKTTKKHERIFLFGDTFGFGTHADPVVPGQPLTPEGAAVSGSGSTMQCITSPTDSTIVHCSPDSAYDYHGRDPFARSTTRHGDKPLEIHFFMNPATDLPRFITPTDLQGAQLYNGPIKTAGDDIPNAGISIDGTIYIVYSTGSDASATGTASNGCPLSHQDSYAVLVKFVQPPPACLACTPFFQTQRAISYVTPGDGNPIYAGLAGHFLFTSPHHAGTLEGFSNPMVLIYGVGWYRCSDVYLAMVPQKDFPTLTNAQFFLGLDGKNQPMWSAPGDWTIAADAAAQPVVTDETSTGVVASLPSIGNINVSFVKEQGLNLWLMTYDSRADGLTTTPPGERLVYFRYATSPWGPWSDPPQIIYDPCLHGGFGTFIFYYATKNDNPCPSALPANTTTFPAWAGPAGPAAGEEGGTNPAQTRGTVFAPHMIERFTKVNGNTLSIYYTMSTWNPYTVVKMRSDFQIVK